VGVLYGVFGQIYQTGAITYDFYLVWTAFISLWVIISNFPPLWLLYLFLVNLTFGLYSEQVAQNWSSVFILTILFLFNTLCLALSLYLPKIINEFKVPSWFVNIIALASVSFATMGIINGIFMDKTINTFQHQQSSFFILLLLTAILYTIGLIYGLRIKSGGFLSMIPFSLIIIISAFLLKISHEAIMSLIVSMFVIISITFVIKILINILKNPANE
jgi:uncharacterized membrane protein